MKNNILLIVSFAIGLGLGYSAHHKLTRLATWAAKHWGQAILIIIGLSVGAFGQYELTRTQQYRTENERKIEETWNATYTEEKIHERMLQLQSALEALKTDGIAKNAETLSKQAELLSRLIEMQGGIEDLIIKLRELQQAKYNWLSATIGAIGGALITAG